LIIIRFRKLQRTLRIMQNVSTKSCMFYRYRNSLFKKYKHKKLGLYTK